MEDPVVEMTVRTIKGAEEACKAAAATTEVWRVIVTRLDRLDFAPAVFKKLRALRAPAPPRLDGWLIDGYKRLRDADRLSSLIDRIGNLSESIIAKPRRRNYYNQITAASLEIRQLALRLPASAHGPVNALSNKVRKLKPDANFSRAKVRRIARRIANKAKRLQSKPIDINPEPIDMAAA